MRNAVSKNVVKDVVVTLTAKRGGSEDTSVTNQKGEYTFKNVAPGEYNLSFQGASLLPYGRSLTVQPGRTLRFNADLAPDTAQSEEIVVTGSRIPSVATDTYSPVTKVTRATLEQSGQAWVGNFLQQLPEVAGALNTQVNNGGDGSVRVDLRNLGANRTLILLNGRRIVPAGAGNTLQPQASVDTLNIPAAAIERIEIIKDGASAIYGSDAIAGVVNFITRSEFSGVEVSAQAGISQRGDAEQYQISISTGHIADRGSIFFSGTITGQGAALQGPSRRWSAYDWSTSGPYDYGTGTTGLGYMTPQGSSITTTGFFGTPTDPNSMDPEWRALLAAYPTSSAAGGIWTYDPTVPTIFRPYNATTVQEGGGDLYNFSPENYIITPNLRLNLFANGTYKLGPNNTKLYFEGLYTNRLSDQRLAPIPFASTNERITVSGANVYNPFGTGFVDVRKRIVEAGPRVFGQNIDTFRVLFGMRGDFLPQWRWDVNFNYGRSQGAATTAGLFNRRRMEQALGPSFINANGVAQCGTPSAALSLVDCVPFDVFGGEITQAMLRNVSFRGTGRSFTQQIMAGAYTSAEIVRIANAVSPIGVAAGYEHRREAGAAIPDPITNQGDVIGNKTEITEGSYYVNEVFAEVNAPLLGRFGEFAGLGNLLEVTAAGRLVAYNNFGANFSYRFGGRVSPIQDIVLRVNYATGFRAPSIAELFAGTGDSFDFTTDPCRGAAPGSRPANCENSDPNIGAPANLNDPRTQQLTRVGGNRNLNPETSTSFSAGLVVQPRWVPDLTLTVDFYNLDVQGLIQRLGANFILSRCYPTGGDAPEYCDRITRLASNGTIDQIQDPNINIGSRATNGLDVQVNYSPQTPIGRFTFDLAMNFVTRYSVTLANGTTVEGVGISDVGAGGRNWLRGRGIIAWGHMGFSAAVNIRFLSGFRECPNNDCLVGTLQNGSPRLIAGAPEPRSRMVPSWAQADITLGYRADWSPSNSTTFSVGVSNLFDASPEYIVGASNGFDATMYDTRGRFFFANITHTFK